MNAKTPMRRLWTDGTRTPAPDKLPGRSWMRRSTTGSPAIPWNRDRDGQFCDGRRSRPAALIRNRTTSSRTTAVKFGAEHWVQTRDLRLGNDAARCPRFSPTLHESARNYDFLRVFRGQAGPWFHESSRGFSSVMCPACATVAHEGSPSFARRCAGRGAAWMLNRAHLYAL